MMHLPCFVLLPCCLEPLMASLVPAQRLERREAPAARLAFPSPSYKQNPHTFFHFEGSNSVESMSYSHENAPMEQNYIGDYKLQQRWEWRGSGMACIRIRALGRRRGCPKIPAAFPISLYDLQKRSNGPRRLVRSNGCKEWTDGRKIGERLYRIRTLS
ncbi:hypothetical protein ACLOJK_002870 [Asimina triloba]